MSSALFLIVMFNPKDAAYSYLPIVYAVSCLVIGCATNLLAKRAEAVCLAPVEKSTTEEGR